nr:hypothetical protein [uncultured Desulfobacter sp.]
MGRIITDDKGFVIRDNVTLPGKVKIPGHTYYAMIFGGVEWMIKISSHPDPKFSNLFLDESGKLSLPQIHFSETLAEISSMYQRYK